MKPDRIGLLGFYTNQPRNSQADYEEAADLFRQVGESWEQLTAMGISTTAYAMDAQFDRAQQIFVDVKELASELGSKMHLAWAHCFAPFYRYLIGQIDAREAGEEIEFAIPFAVECNDFGAEILARGHLCAIAVRERDPDEAARLAKITHATLWRNKGRLPARTPQIALVYTGEAALYALQENHVDKQRLQQIVTRSARRAIKLGKNFPYILGPAMRLKASYTAYSRGKSAAGRQFNQTLRVLEQGSDRWQTGVGYYEAAYWLTEDRAEHIAKAQSIFEHNSLPVELARLERLQRERLPEQNQKGAN